MIKAAHGIETRNAFGRRLEIRTVATMTGSAARRYQMPNHHILARSAAQKNESQGNRQRMCFALASKQIPCLSRLVAGDDAWNYRNVSQTDSGNSLRAPFSRGLKAGDRVALLWPTGRRSRFAYYACFRIGAIAVMNIRLKNENGVLCPSWRPALILAKRSCSRRFRAFQTIILASNTRSLSEAAK